MHIPEFTDEVYKLIERIVARTEGMNKYKGRIPAIEIDLAMEDIRKLYDCYALIKSIASSAEKLGEEPVAEVSSQTGEPVVSIPDENAPGQKTGPEPEPEVLTETKAEEVPADIDGEEEHKEKGKEKQILADKLKNGDARSINDLIAARKSDTSISTRMQQNPISNLKSAIGINEKFIFVYELFGGNMQQYSQVIDQLNTMPGRNEAISLMETLRHQYHWDIENMAFQKLVDMVTRRYS